MKKKKIIRIAIVLGIAAALIFIPPMLAEARRATITETTAPAHIFSVRTENVEIRTLQAQIEVNANIVSGHQVVVMPDANGRLASMRVGLGDIVQQGQIIGEVDPSRPGAIFSMSAVHAPVSGMVITTPSTVGSTVSVSTPLMTLAVGGSTEIDALIPEREVGQLITGLSAEIRLEAFPGETFAATLTQISPVVDPVSRTKRVTLRFNNQDPRINPGMFARVRLNTRTYENVVSIPQEALLEHRGRTIVYVLNTADDGTSYVEMREVVVGVTIDRETEIRSGLEAGEAVVVQGQQFLADGVPVRVIGRTL
ncbi:MAG: efflux RND transporter periplasmic adaptor subunit [Treponema sp.]|nr:efflux RND transporter periplasmic adaptor subunit [Treponema sp.]